ncbi:MAG: low affinity iron permease family protein [Ignavibacteria bacterium]|nr:low affinity iron permease family protein [Ignavibacteria bacterium]
MANRKSKNNRLEIFFETLAVSLTRFSGSTTAFVLAVTSVILWIATGPLFNYGDGWQLVINTGTTIITFLMVFLIQRAQNKDSLATHLKLDELIASLSGASNRMIDIENISEQDLEIYRKQYHNLSQLFEKEKDIKRSHSIEDSKPKRKRKETVK